MNRNSGQSLVEFAVVGGIIIIIAVIALSALGKNVFNLFGGSKAKYEVYQPFQKGNNENNNANSGNNNKPAPEPAEFEPSPSNPKITCSGNSCTLDFGDYVIEGIPGDFSDYIQSSGTSGGTDYLATILEQVADQAPVDQETKNLIRQLSTHGHGIAIVEYNLDDLIQTHFEHETFQNAEGLLGELMTGTDMTGFESVLENINNSMGSNADPAYQNTLVIVNALAGNIIDIAGYLNQKTIDLGATGDNADAILSDGMQEYEYFTHDGARATDLDSEIICGMGNGTDNGYICN